MFIAALLILLAGLAAGAGYQIVRRRTRPEPGFRGPSPILLLLIQVTAVYTPLIVISSLGVIQSDSAFGFLFTSIALLAGYVGVAGLFGVRSGALARADLGLPTGLSASRIVRDIGIGSITMLGVWFAATLVAALVASLLGASAPTVIPQMGTTLEFVLVALGAALLVPIGEELFFRGYALTAWRRDLGLRSALLRSTLFFAFVHIATISSDTFEAGLRQAVLVVIVIVPVGLALGLLFVRRGLVAAIAGHATYNLVGVILLALAQSLAPGGPVS